MAATHTNTNGQVYNIREEDTLLSRVALVICVIAQRELYLAGFSITKELLTVHYTGYNANKPVWELDFFEQSFANEPLLSVREKVKGVFISNQANLIVPDELYSAAAARQWLERIHHVGRQDDVAQFTLVNDKATYLFAVPVNISELIKINFKKSAVLPLPAYHFGVRPPQSLQMQCCISHEQVTVTLHNYSQLLWHNVFDYTCAEDIAFAIKLLCRENYIDAAKLNITCNAFSGAEYEVINDLTQYFPSLKCGNGHTIHERWEPAISLANQLLACVS